MLHNCILKMPCFRIPKENYPGSEKKWISHFFFIFKHTNWSLFGNIYSFWLTTFPPVTWRSTFTCTTKVRTHTKVVLISLVTCWNSGMPWYHYIANVNFSTSLVGLFWNLAFWSEMALLYFLLNNKGLGNLEVVKK